MAKGEVLTGSSAVGAWCLARGRSVIDVLDLLGRTVVGVGRLLSGRTGPLTPGFTATLYQAGVETLPVVALFGLAAGTVLTLIATQQLNKFGLPAVVPKLIGIVVLREIGPLMTGIVMAGSVASAFAADVAGARVSQASGAEPVAGDPAHSLVAPRVLALMLCGPLLVAYANGVAVVGATAIGAGMMDQPPRAYFDTVLSGLGIKNAVAGLVKGAVFGCVAGFAGCYHGFRCAKGQTALGRAVRDGVVSGVVCVGLASAALTFVFKWIKL